MQFLLGPRQVGKTTGLESFLDKYKGAFIYEMVEADFNPGGSWIRLQWQKALAKGSDTLLIIDEIQKIENWAETIKSLWDSTKKNKQQIKCLFLGSSSLNLQKGLSESLTGRYEVISCFHWSYSETLKISPNLSVEEFCRKGGYPKSYEYLKDEKRFLHYIRDSIVKNVIEKDILLNHTVKKPALFKQTAEILASYPGKEISYTKILGQLQESGNVDLVKYYIELFEAAYLFKAVHKYSGAKSKLSSPKILCLAPAISYAFCSIAIDFGWLFENAVGAELLKHVDKLYYWREGDYEIDFIVEVRKKLIAIEVKSGRNKNSKSLDVFKKSYPEMDILIIDPDEFFRLCKQKDDFFKQI
jgi:predicted AAA+ superfamily ATPase